MAEALDVSRRQFVVLAATCAAACACGDALAAGPATRPAEKIDIGAAADYATDGVYDKFVKSHKILVYREEGQLYVSTALCTHRGVPLQLKDGTPYCPRHGSMFSVQGTVTHGPAKLSLERYAVSTDDKGRLIVDTGTSFREKKWNDPASFVKIS